MHPMHPGRRTRTQGGSGRLGLRTLSMEGDHKRNPGPEVSTPPERPQAGPGVTINENRERKF
jgi:hypothetical protein